VIPMAIHDAALPDGLVAIPVRTRLIVKGDDLVACRGEILQPKLGMAGKAYPDRLMRRPFGRLAHDRSAFSINRGNRVTA